MEHNTAIKYLRYLKQNTYKAFKKHLIAVDPFESYKLKYNEVVVEYLTEIDIPKLLNKEFTVKRLE